MSTKQLRKNALNALTYAKRNGAKLASKGAACALVVGSCAYGVSAMAEESSTTNWPTADSVLGNLQSSLGPWIEMGLLIAGSVLVLKLGYGYAKQFLFRS